MTHASHNQFQPVIDAINGVLADTLALYLKSKNYHWHVTGPRFRDLHLLFEEQAVQLFAMVDLLAERSRKLGGRTLTSIGAVSAAQSLADDDRADRDADSMVATLAADNAAFADKLRALKATADAAGDVATSALIDGWVDEAEQRVWFLNATGG